MSAIASGNGQARDFFPLYSIVIIFNNCGFSLVFSFYCRFSLGSVQSPVSISVFNLNSSDGRVVRASASESVDSASIPSRVKSLTLKLVFTAFLLDAQH